MNIITPIIFIILWTIFGVVLLVSFLDLKIFRDVKNLLGQKIQINPLIFYISSGYIVGTIVSNWLVYIFAYIFQDFSDPIFLGNVISIFCIVFFVVLLIFYKKKYFLEIFYLKQVKFNLNINIFFKSLFFAFLFVVSIFLMFYTFKIIDNKLAISPFIFGDMAAHVSMIRSFSFGDNFPTLYPLYPDIKSGIRYHFMFYFMVANLEKLGLPLDLAVNIPGVFGLFFFLVLLYQFSFVLFGKFIISFLSVLIFLFRNGISGVVYIVSIINYLLGGTFVKNGIEYTLINNPLYINNNIVLDIFSAIFNIDFLIGNTPKEEWGFYSMNVYINQRHFAFALCLLLITLIYLYPFVYKSVIKTKSKLNFPITNLFRFNFFSSFLIQSIFLGMLLGSLGFWNGSVLLSTLCILFGFFIFCRYKLNLLIIILISLFSFFLQIKFFVLNGNDSISNVSINYGYTLEFSNRDRINYLISKKNIIEIIEALVLILKTIPDVLFFILNVSGFMLIGILFVLFQKRLYIFKKLYILFIVSFFIPFIFGFFIQLTPDININHKYIIISLFLLNIFFALSIYFFSKFVNFSKFVIIPFISFFFITGIIEWIAIINANSYERSFFFDFQNNFYNWIINNTSKDSIFLTHPYSLHPITLAGRKMFFGWPYYSWAFGYKNIERENFLKEIYSFKDIFYAKSLLEKENINYVLIDHEIRNNSNYNFDENTFSLYFPLVFEDLIDGIRVYKVIKSNI